MKAVDPRLKTWTPAVPRRAPDNIISSDYTTAKVFMPSYEKELRPRIEQLLTNDYQRIWWKEKQIWDETIAEKIPGKRILPRMLIKRKVPTCVTVKYRVQTGRWKGRKKQDSKSNLKTEIKQESTKNAKTEELKSVEDNDKKLEKCEETKSEKHKGTQSEHEKEREDESKEEREGESTD